ncbi:putative uncharacterized protein DDB_G0282133 [Penaeus monodon]|uniref:putative uncharacterized protein DDB_G0282133 n=1 Tax=Penaeus monodon TaxID=6687 RepID=UPI0018A7489D|nr:putative uncharacterized protein DDB_G0282133 [Penaeus monodon]
MPGPAPTSDRVSRPPQPDYIRTRHSSQVIVGRTSPHVTDMKALVVVALAATAVGQQFQLQRQYDTAVRLATPGYFQQGGSFTSPSFRNTNGQLQGDSFQNSFQTATSDSNSFRQSGLFQNSNQLQRNADTNTNQFQTFPAELLRLECLPAEHGSPFQQNSNAQSGNSFFQSGSNQFGSDNRFQTNTNQINSGSRFQSIFDNQDSNNRFQSSFNNQDSNQFQSTFNNQGFQQQIPIHLIPTTDSSPPSTTRIPATASLKNSQSSSFLRSGSSFDSSTDSVSGVFEPLNLPSGASALLGGITSSFNCLDRPYATTLTRTTHPCLPRVPTQHFSQKAPSNLPVQVIQLIIHKVNIDVIIYLFMCGEGSVFDQKELACVAESSAIPCQESSNYYYTNEQFGRPAPTFDRVSRPSQPDYIRTRHSSQVIVGRTSHMTDMKVLVVVALAAATVGQQFQLQRQYDTAVRLATPGFFQQGGSFTSPSFRNTNGQLQGDSFQNSFQTATSDSNSFRQSGLFQNSNQLQRNADTNTNQFQTTSFQQSSFDSNAFQQNSGSPFQQNSNAQSGNSFFQSGSNQFGSDNRFQTNTNQINSRSRFQSSFDNQNSINRLQSSINNQDSNNRFQSTFNNQNSNNRFQSTFNNQDSNNRFQSTFNNQDSSNRFSQNSQSSSFLETGSSFDSSSDSVSGVFEPLNLPSGASALLGSITSSFSCLDRPYGYYADQDNSYRVFHVCNPTLFSNGAVETYQYSFMCGEGSVFDQKELACVAESSAIPCQESTSYFYTNEQFGRPEDKSF